MCIAYDLCCIGNYFSYLCILHGFRSDNNFWRYFVCAIGRAAVAEHVATSAGGGEQIPFKCECLVCACNSIHSPDVRTTTDDLTQLN